jgi:hypothetical protein
MIRFAVVAILLAGCRLSLEDEVTAKTCTVGTSPECLAAADAPASLTWLETNIFEKHCNFSGCHKGAAGESIVDLTPGNSYAHLVNFTSNLDRARKIVVPSDIESSYLMLMLQDIEPGMANPPAARLPTSGPMPQSAEPLCCQKLDAIERWITAGAPNN